MNKAWQSRGAVGTSPGLEQVHDNSLQQGRTSAEGFPLHGVRSTKKHVVKHGFPGSDPESIRVGTEAEGGRNVPWRPGPSGSE